MLVGPATEVDPPHPFRPGTGQKGVFATAGQLRETLHDLQVDSYPSLAPDQITYSRRQLGLINLI